MTHGICRWGDKCKFSYEKPEDAGDAGENETGDEEEVGEETEDLPQELSKKNAAKAKPKPKGKRSTPVWCVPRLRVLVAVCVPRIICGPCMPGPMAEEFT